MLKMPCPPFFSERIILPRLEVPALDAVSAVEMPALDAESSVERLACDARRFCPSPEIVYCLRVKLACVTQLPPLHNYIICCKTSLVNNERNQRRNQRMVFFWYCKACTHAMFTRRSLEKTEGRPRPSVIVGYAESVTRFSRFLTAMRKSSESTVAS